VNSVTSLAGAAPAAPARLVTLFTLPVSQPGFLLLADSVVVYQGNEVGAYGLAAGRSRWRAQVPQRVGRVAVVPAARVLVAATSGNDPDSRISVFDLDTGTPLWSDGAGLLDVAAGAPLVLQRFVGPDGAVGVRARDARTGVPVWSYAPPPGPARDVTVALTGTGPGRVLFRDSLGTAWVVDEDSGRLLATGTLADLAVPSTVDIVGTVLYQAVVVRGRATVIGYDLGTLARRWRTEVDLAPESGDPLLLDCGAVLCLSARPLMAGLDPVDGTLLWRTASYFYGTGLAGDRLLASFGIGIGPSAIVAARTLRTVLDMGGWRLVRPPGGAGAGYGSQLAVLGPRPVPTRLGRLPRTGVIGAGTGPGAPVTWVAAVAPGTGTIGPLGRLGDAALADCQGGGGFLACRVAGGGIRVWRYRP